MQLERERDAKWSLRRSLLVLLKVLFATHASLFFRKSHNDLRLPHQKEELKMELKKFISTVIVMSVVTVSLAACEKEPGPAEKAGKAVDNATEKAGQRIEKAGEDIKDTAKGDKK